MEWRVVKGGGPLLINGTHDFDDLNFLTGMKPIKVYASAHNTIRHKQVEDSCSAVVEYFMLYLCPYDRYIQTGVHLVENIVYSSANKVTYCEFCRSACANHDKTSTYTSKA